jgi:hypothetical protein
MAKTLSRKKYLRVIYTKFKQHVIDVTSPILLPRTKIYTSFIHEGVACYCSVHPKYGTYRITFGGAMIGNTLKLPATFDIAGARKKFDITNRVYRAVYYHEIGHLKFTAMHCTLILDYKERKYIPAIHKLFNILEDIVIERYCMSVKYPYTKKYFKLLEDLLFDDDAMKKYEDKGDYLSFLNFLLLKLRKKKDFLGANKFALDHPEYLEYVKMVLTEPDGSKRIEKTIVFFEWLIAQGLTIPELPDSPTEKIPFSPGKDKSEHMAGEAGTVEKDTSSMEIDGKGTSSAKKKEELSEEAEEASAFGSEDGEDKAEEDEDEDGEDVIDTDSDPVVPEDELEESCIEALGAEDYGHEFYNVKDYFEPTDATREELDKLFEQTSTLATQVSTKIKTFKVRTRPRYIEGYPSGKLHVPSVINGKPINIFQRKESKGLETDLAVYLLIDNSGSMGSSKSRVATLASIALAQACAKTNIPCAISMFTANFDGVGATCYTYRLKDFKDSFEKFKYYLGASDYSILSTYKYDSSNFITFKGNTDEINLFHVHQEFKRTSYKDKVLIIISDGATCGSTENLRNLAKEVEKDMFVIGIGAISKAPEYIYKYSKIFNTFDELSGLADFIGDMLFKLSKGSKGGK